MPGNHAQGAAAWDGAGAENAFRGSFVDPRDAARTLKQGARLSILDDWGMDEAIAWFHVPVFRGSKALKSFHRWFEDQIVGLVNPSLTHWRAVSGEDEIIVIWDDCVISEPARRTLNAPERLKLPAARQSRKVPASETLSGTDAGHEPQRERLPRAHANICYTSAALRSERRRTPLRSLL